MTGDHGQGHQARIPETAALRRELAFEMVRRFDKLDRADEDFLAKLGDDAFPAVFNEFLKAAAATNIALDKPRETLSKSLAKRFYGLGDLLTKVRPSKARTPALLAALSKCTGFNDGGNFILEALEDHGEPSLTIPYFIKVTKEPTSNVWLNRMSREFLIGSQAPAAVAYLIKALKSPFADPTLKSEAYYHFAQIGWPNELKAVLSARHNRKLLTPLAIRVMEDINRPPDFGSRNKVLHIRRGVDGRTWGLIRCGILGSNGDLWLAEMSNGKWIHPLFTGVSMDGVSRWAKPKPPEPKIAGFTAKQLNAGAWFSALVQSRELRQDTSGGGMTDLEKMRLGLNIYTKDTDRDGDPDDVDPWPNAPQRPLNDAEQVIAAVFEARFQFDRSQGPALFFAPWDMKPFEMVGRSGPTIWVPFIGQGDRWQLPLERCYEQGVAFISILPANLDAHTTSPIDVIQWNPDRTEAQLSISTSFGGLEGDGYKAVVRKVRKAWVVVSLKMAWIS